MALILGKMFRYRMVIVGELGGVPDTDTVRAVVMQQTQQSMLLGSAAKSVQVEVEEIGDAAAVGILPFGGRQ